MTITKHEIRRGTYYDSVVLMQLQRGLAALPGVIDAGVVMATPANCDLLSANHLLPDALAASPDDLLIVVRANDERSAADAIGQIEALLARRRSPQASQNFRPRSLAGAVKQLPEAGWVLVSVPGRYAAGVAREALDLGRHVFLYSDNVSLEEEVALKKTALEKGLLVMGPDCGTAIVNGIGLGFANRVRRGPIGLVGASGTGLQAVASHIHSLGSGISHAIGTGGRDLRAEVGAITAHQGLDLLAHDPDTRVIVLISKPPSSGVAAGLIDAARQAGKPVVLYFIGYAVPARRLGNIHFAVSLSETAELAVVQGAAAPGPGRPVSRPVRGYLRGLFSGGTLAYEMLLGLQTFLSPIYSNAPITSEQSLEDPLHSQAHSIVDLGDEFFMVGRLHPMIDNDLRIRRMRQEAADEQVGLFLFDVVLGEGSHPDPAGELVPVIRSIGEERSDIHFVALVVGTEDDPQNLQNQVNQLQEAGVVIFRTAAETVEYLSSLFGSQAAEDKIPVDPKQLNLALAAINVGLESFYESLLSQGAQAVHVDWRPPAGGNEKLASLLARMKK